MRGLWTKQKTEMLAEIWLPSHQPHHPNSDYIRSLEGTLKRLWQDTRILGEDRTGRDLRLRLAVAVGHRQLMALCLHGIVEACLRKKRSSENDGIEGWVRRAARRVFSHLTELRAFVEGILYTRGSAEELLKEAVETARIAYAMTILSGPDRTRTLVDVEDLPRGRFLTRLLRTLDAATESNVLQLAEDQVRRAIEENRRLLSQDTYRKVVQHSPMWTQLMRGATIFGSSRESQLFARNASSASLGSLAEVLLEPPKNETEKSNVMATQRSSIQASKAPDAPGDRRDSLHQTSVAQKAPATVFLASNSSSRESKLFAGKSESSLGSLAETLKQNANQESSRESALFFDKESHSSLGSLAEALSSGKPGKAVNVPSNRAAKAENKAVASPSTMASNSRPTKPEATIKMTTVVAPAQIKPEPIPNVNTNRPTTMSFTGAALMSLNPPPLSLKKKPVKTEKEKVRQPTSNPLSPIVEFASALRVRLTNSQSPKQEELVKDEQ